jgi:hypothetical protein
LKLNKIGYIRGIKKIFQKSGCATFSTRCIKDFVSSFNSFFWSHHFNNSIIALQYIKGLLVCKRGKANMERMEEEVPESEYRAYQQFISNSRWDYLGVNRKVAVDTSVMLAQHKRDSGCLTGFIIDESAHLKKGEYSVGVSKQYAGIVGKVENCQVGVYGSLVNDRYATLTRMGKLVERVREYNNNPFFPGANIQDYNVLWPIPQSEIDLNINGNLEQNPGY